MAWSGERTGRAPDRPLTDLLRFVKPDGFRAPPCLGYVKIVESDHATRFGIVFEKPSIDGAQSDVVTL